MNVFPLTCFTWTSSGLGFIFFHAFFSKLWCLAPPLLLKCSLNALISEVRVRISWFSLVDICHSFSLVISIYWSSAYVVNLSASMDPTSLNSYFLTWFRPQNFVWNSFITLEHVPHWMMYCLVLRLELVYYVLGFIIEGVVINLGNQQIKAIQRKCNRTQLICFPPLLLRPICARYKAHHQKIHHLN